ncbi:MAG: hypothetical protein QGH37_32215 [Candidatus Poribacteria bacterium]|jgi:hypothetical protein|nr:hypothetical protein [Candidatus Poribacteria bacterium]MDP6997384.1 hypothetical protein [Candidatus Poribacteria bacterium]
MSLKDLVKTSIFGILIFYWLLPGYSQGFKKLKNLAASAEVEAEGADIPVTNVNDEDFTTRWNAKNDDVDTWILFKWKKSLKVNRVHVTEFRSRIRGHTIEYGSAMKEVQDLVMEPENANASPNHPGNQREPVKIPDHVLTFKTVETTVLRYHMTKTVDASSEPSLWEIEIFFDPEAYPVRPEGALATMWAQIKRGKREN